MLGVFTPLVGNTSLQPAMKLGQGNVFTGICDSVHKEGWGGGLPQCMLGSPWEQNPPEQAPPKQAPLPGAGTPPEQAPPCKAC